MYPAFRATWIKLRRPALLWGTYGAVAAVMALITSLVFLTVAGAAPIAAAPVAPGPPGQPGLPDLPGDLGTVGSLARAGGLLDGLTGGATVLGLIAMCVAAAAVAGDYSSGTLRNLLIRRPQRGQLLAGTWAAVASFALLASLLAAVVAAGTALIAGAARGVGSAGWFDPTGWSVIVRTVSQVALATVGYATLGSALGVLLRSAALAIGLAVAWLLPGEAILGSTVDGSGRWLPGRLFAAVASNGSPDIALGTALLTGAGYLALAVLAAGVSFARRDVTA